jgi:hypothetical protein
MYCTTLTERRLYRITGLWQRRAALSFLRLARTLRSFSLVQFRRDIFLFSWVSFEKCQLFFGITSYFSRNFFFLNLRFSFLLFSQGLSLVLFRSFFFRFLISVTNRSRIRSWHLIFSSTTFFMSGSTNDIKWVWVLIFLCRLNIVLSKLLSFSWGHARSSASERRSHDVGDNKSSKIWEKMVSKQSELTSKKVNNKENREARKSHLSC